MKKDKKTAEKNRDITEHKRAEETLSVSEVRYRRLFETARDGILILDAETGMVVDVNPFLIEMLGYSHEQFMGKTVWELGFLKDVVANRDMFAELQRREYIRYEDLPLETSDGRRIAVEFISNVYLINHKKVIQCNICDITERKRVEEELQRSEQSFKSISENAHDGIIVALRNGARIYANRRASEITGYSINEILKTGMEGLAHPDEILKLSERRKKILAGENVPNQYDTVIIHKDGNAVPIEITSARTLWYGQVADIFVFRDITERKRAEEALKKSEEYFKEITENASDIIIITDKNGDIKYCSRSVERFTGYKPEELVGRSAFTFINPDDVKRSVSAFGKAVLTKDAVSNAFRIVHKDGSERYFDGLGKNLLDNPAVAGFIMNIRDLTERKQAEKALQESEEKYRTLFETMAQGVVYQTADRKIASANPAAERILGLALDQMQGQPSVNQRWKVIHEDGSDFPRETYPSAVALKSGREVLNVVIGILNPENNSLRWINVNAIPQFKPGENKPYQVYTTFEDITERKRAEEALRESEERFRIATETTNDVVYEWDLQHTVQWFGNIDELLGYGPGKFPRTMDAWTDSIHLEDRERVMAAVQAKLDGRAPYAIEYRVRRQDGVNRWWSARGDIVKTPDGNPIKWIGTITDITERKRAEEELRDSEEKLRIIFESIGDGIIVTNLEGIIIQTNEAAAKLGGWSDKSKLIGMSGFDFVAEKEQSKLVTDMIRALKQQHSINVEYSVKAKNGREYQSEVSITLLRDASGSPNGIVSVIRDITERKRVEEALRESEKKYRLLAENASDVITVMDMNMRPIYMSPSITRLLGYSVEEAMARGIENGLTPKSLKVATKGLAKTIAAELKKKKLKPVTVDFELTRKDGSTVWVAASVALIRGSDGQPTEILSILHDISERKKAEEDLVKYKDHLEELVEERTTELDKAKLIAEEASKAKSEFLANMSHEIRTPLSSIIGFSELLVDEVNGLLNNDQKKYLGYVTSSGQHLLSLINDILDLSKVEAGKMELQPTSFSISDLLKNSSSFIAEEAMKHNIRLLSEIPADVDVIEADERKVKQIIYNLLSNAVKFTPDGGSITTKADIVSPDSAALPIKIRKGLPDTEYVLVSVKDTGIGIAKKDQSKLFTEFHQIENPYTKKYEGTGLGLALSRKLVTLHGGRIWFESKGKGKGCTFYFILPLIILPNA